jgi:hypothetical protein
LINENSSRGKMKIFKFKMRHFLPLFFLSLFILFSNKGYSQYNIKWMTAGSIQSWFSEIGSEIEEGRVKEQQDGMQWPAIYQYQDCEAARAFWIGAKNFTDENGINYPYKVVHVGPRVTGAGEFFPQKFEMTSKFDPPVVSVDGITSYNNPTDNDNVDPNIKWDRMIVNVDNTQLGITMTRKIMQFSQQYHDNYFVYDYTFTNTGNTNADQAIELPNQTVKGIYFFWQYRNAVCREPGYVIGNATRWGINTMNDVRGDGLKPDPAGQQFRAQFSWHGKYPPFTSYDNIGAPIWKSEGILVAASDTVGRLGAPQFIGVVTLHADKSAADSTDDPSQPSTTAYVGSDEPETSNNDAYNVTKMTKEYENWMAPPQGHKQRHADVVEPGGNFDQPTGDPAIGTPGGFSFANGYGPYDLAPGENIHIVLAEGIAGIDRETATNVGKQYKQSIISAKEKNDVVLTGMDSLFQTFNRAIANYNSGYSIPEPPLPPKIFNVNSGGDRISLSWEVYNASDPNLDGFEIYRAVGKYDSTYHLLYTAGSAERSYDDVTPIRGLNYYYYIVSIGSASGNDGTGLTPAGRLRSSRYYTQSYDPAKLKREAGKSMDAIRIVPNPFNISASKELGFGEEQANRLAFFNIPGRCVIKIYSEIGELIQTIVHTDGSGDDYWDSVTSSNQIVVSGIYIAVIENSDTGDKKILKFAIIR